MTYATDSFRPVYEAAKRQDMPAFAEIMYALRDREWHTTTHVIAAGGRHTGIEKLKAAGKLDTRRRGGVVEVRLT